MADVSILDINGSQWNFKDTEARNVLSRNNTYSTTEIKTGKTWINGKPIYRKIFNPLLNGVIQQGYSQNGGNWYGFTELQAADMVVNAYLLNKRSDNFVEIFNSCNSSVSQAFVPKIGSNLCYLSFVGAFTLFIVIEYTKTSD